MANQVFENLLKGVQYKDVVVKSVIALVDQYFAWIKDDTPLVTGKNKSK